MDIEELKIINNCDEYLNFTFRDRLRGYWQKPDFKKALPFQEAKNNLGERFVMGYRPSTGYSYYKLTSVKL
jgi:hypothetical protein